VQHAASATTTPDTRHRPDYRHFCEAVARAQLAAWLPPGRQVLVDVSGPRAPSAELAARAGHTVLRVLERTPGDAAAPGAAPGTGAGAGARADRDAGAGARADRNAGARDDRGAGAGARGDRDAGAGARDDRDAGAGPRGRIFPLIADSSRLSFLPDACADGVIAEDRALSTHLGAEALVADFARVLRPAGRVLACVDSLVLGMALLAGQSRWPHLVDLPHAEVVLVPWPDGTITRCYGPDQARELFGGAGLLVNWIRPRTVFSESMVTHALAEDPASLPRLVRAELAAAGDESVGAQLVISACKC
jgi:hypothetical protein